MKLNNLLEAKWINVIGGANAGSPGYKYPDSHPHEVVDDVGTWLHGTSDLFLDNIKANGLTNGRNHLTREREVAVFSANRAVKRWGGNPVILIVDGSKLPEDLVGTAVDSFTGAVPPGAILKVTSL